MNKSELSVLGITAVLAVGLASLVARNLYKQNYPTVPPATVTSFKPSDVLGQDPTFRGNPKSAFVLVEFADFQCPPCIAAQTQVQQVLSQHSSNLAMVFHNFPLSIHPQAMPAAQAFEYAQEQGKAWPMYDALFQQHGSLDPSQIQALAQGLGLDAKRFQSNYNGSAQAAVEKDIRLGKKLGVDSTPTFFLCCSNHKVFQLYTAAQAENFLR